MCQNLANTLLESNSSGWLLKLSSRPSIMGVNVASLPLISLLRRIHSSWTALIIDTVDVAAVLLLLLSRIFSCVSVSVCAFNAACERCAALLLSVYCFTMCVCVFICAYLHTMKAAYLSICMHSTHMDVYAYMRGVASSLRACEHICICAFSLHVFMLNSRYSDIEVEKEEEHNCESV